MIKLEILPITGTRSENAPKHSRALITVAHINNQKMGIINI